MSWSTPGEIWPTPSPSESPPSADVPDAQASTVASTTGWEPLEVRPIESQEAVRVVARRLAEAAERRRDRNRLGNLDLASQDVAIEVLRALEKAIVDGARPVQ
jgi:hypothetical protein